MVQRVSKLLCLTNIIMLVNEFIYANFDAKISEYIIYIEKAQILMQKSYK